MTQSFPPLLVFAYTLIIIHSIFSARQKAQYVKGSMIFSVVTQMGDNTEYLFLSSK